MNRILSVVLVRLVFLVERRYWVLLGLMVLAVYMGGVVHAQEVNWPQCYVGCPCIEVTHGWAYPLGCDLSAVIPLWPDETCVNHFGLACDWLPIY